MSELQFWQQFIFIPIDELVINKLMGTCSFRYFCVRVALIRVRMIMITKHTTSPVKNELKKAKWNTVSQSPGLHIESADDGGVGGIVILMESRRKGSQHPKKSLGSLQNPTSKCGKWHKFQTDGAVLRIGYWWIRIICYKKQLKT